MIVSETDKVIYDAMNKGIKKATGDIIGFLNSDDWFDNKNILKEIAEEFITKDIDAVYGDLVFVKDENDKTPKENGFQINTKKIYFQLAGFHHIQLFMQN